MPPTDQMKLTASDCVYAIVSPVVRARVARCLTWILVQGFDPYVGLGEPISLPQAMRSYA